jgi:DNA invertase Pin-like site-specific DNA recombinase
VHDHWRTDLQRDALSAAGIDPAHLYGDRASGRREDSPGLASCLKALRPGDTLVVWKLKRMMEAGVGIEPAYTALQAAA